MSQISNQQGIEAGLGQLIVHDEQEWFVVRIVESSSLFQTTTEMYVLEEKYAELRQRQTGEVGFKIFSEIKHIVTSPELLVAAEKRGLDPTQWRKF